MTLVATNFTLGAEITQSISAPTAANILNDAAGEAWAFSFIVPKTGTIEAVVFRAGTVTSFQDMTISMETVATTGLPSGTNYGSSTAGTWTGGTSNTSPEVALGTSATATVGDIVCVRGEWAGTEGNLSIQYVSGASAISRRFPKVIPDTGSGFVLTTLGTPMITLKYSGSEYLVPDFCYPPCTISSLNISSSTSPQEVGFWWTPTAKMKINGVSIYSRPLGTSQTSTISLYTTPAGTPASQRSIAITHDQFASTTTNENSRTFNPYEVAASTDYVIGILESSTSNHTINYVDVTSASHFGDWAGGANLTWASRNSGGGAFSETTTRKVIGSLFINEIDDGTGSGTGLPKLIGNNSLLG